MGHAQALVNPYVYGIRWRRSALQLAAATDGSQLKGAVAA
jgi:hypothetical protein